MNFETNNSNLKMKINPETRDEKALLEPSLIQSDHKNEIEMTFYGNNRSQNFSLQRLKQNSKSQDQKLKNKMRDFAEGKFVTILMSMVTLFALVGDDIRLWATNKSADIYFNLGLLISFILFTTEIMLNTVAIDEFKYSFFFWLDIIATLSVVIDIPWITDPFRYLIWRGVPSDKSVNVIPGQDLGQGNSVNLQRVVKSLRLIRLIRIIKLYKYIVQSGKKQDNEEINTKKKKKKSGSTKSTFYN